MVEGIWLSIFVMNNPFLDNSFCIPWSGLKPESVEDGISQALVSAKEAIAVIETIDHKDVSYENTLASLEVATEALECAWGKVGHLDSVCNSDKLRTVYNKLLPSVSAFFSSISLNEKLWAVVKAFNESDEAKGLSLTRKRFLDETVKDFTQAGADLPQDEKTRLEKINKSLAEKTQKFTENVLDSTNAWELLIDDEGQLLGLPASALDAAKADALSKGHGSEDSLMWRFTLQAPSLMPAMKYLKSDTLRKQIWQAASEIAATGKYDNTELIKDILGLRQEKAELLGHTDFSDYILERRMAGSGDKAVSFIEALHAKIQDAFKAEVKALDDFKAKKTGESVAYLNPWEVGYWEEQQLQECYDFNEELLRPYFPMNSVLSGLFNITETLFGVTINERQTIFEGELCEGKSDFAGPAVEVWHPEVLYYDMFDGSDVHIGSFYADWHPRSSKRAGAWMNHFRTGSVDGNGKRDPHIGVICGNMTAKIGDKPALLTHNEVQTVFHEFGHLIHHLFGDVDVKSLNGINVKWDFVELPSQLMENFCWERESLDLFARHYETSEVIPDELFGKMIASKNYLSACGTMRQLSLGMMDFKLHRNIVKDGMTNLDEQLDVLLEGYTRSYGDEKYRSIARRFTHIFASAVGYACGYYSYKWAEVLDADAFTRFQELGVLNTVVGQEFKSKILSKGNSVPPDELFRDFMGREPDPDALLKRSGLLN